MHTIHQRDLKALLYLTKIKLIGPVSIRNLISYCGSAQQVLNSGKNKLMQVPGINEERAELIIQNRNQLDKSVDQEMEFIFKHNIHCLPYYDELYPYRLKNIHDAPALLFFKGQACYNQPRCIAVVGTRKATPYGKQFVESLIQDLKLYDPVIVSGLAYGIDIIAHRQAIEHNLNTIAVLGYGLHTVYPASHQSVADKMQNRGGLITEYRTDQKMQPEFFADRNKIIAGLCDAIIVVESAVKGGALITAQYAVDYNRDVFAVPGRVGDSYSEGCNDLIKSNKAALIDRAEDLIKALRWDTDLQKGSTQRRMLFDLNEQEQILFDYLKEYEDAHVDQIAIHTKMTASKVAGILLELELKGAVLALPGKRYRAIT